MCGRQRETGGRASSGAARKKDLRAQERDGGTQLRRCETIARPSLRENAWSGQCAGTMLVGSDGAEHQENCAAVEPPGTESAAGARSISAAPTSDFRNAVVDAQQLLTAGSQDHRKKTTPPKLGGARQQSGATRKRGLFYCQLPGSM